MCLVYPTEFQGCSYEDLSECFGNCRWLQKYQIMMVVVKNEEEEEGEREEKEERGGGGEGEEEENMVHRWAGFRREYNTL